MTREEHISNLETIGCDGWTVTTDAYKSLQFAIKALEQEPCDDAISRQAALNCFTATKLKKFDFILYAREEIKKLPPVNSQPKTGHWISHREHCENLGVLPSGLGAYEWCSNCDCGIDIVEWHRNNYNYCPNCGAKMVESQESEEV